MTLYLGASTEQEYSYDDDGETVTGTYTTDPAIELDNFVFQEYVSITISGDGNYTPVVYNGNYVNGGNYVKGVDISSVISLEANSSFSYGSTDVFQTLKDNGVNSIRIRIWNDPYTSSSQIYGGGQNDADMAVLIAQRAADVGMSVMLSFHLSDFWADPAEQYSPKAWRSYSASEKGESAASFITSTLEKVAATGVDIQFVTIGNETTYWSGISGISYKSTTDIATVLKAGAEAVHSYNSKYGTNILVGAHWAPSAKWDATQNYLQEFVQAYSSLWSSSCFDFFSTSCYPYWSSHASTTNDVDTEIAEGLAYVVKTYNIPVMITEYNWPYVLGSDQDGDGYTSVSSTGTATDSDGNEYKTYVTTAGGYYNAWSVDRQGQADMITYINEHFATYSSSTGSLEGMFIGTYYWEPAWISADNTTTSGDSAWLSRMKIWYNYGSGVATYYGAEYMNYDLTEDADTYWSGYEDPTSSSYNWAHGSQTDEYTLFDASGKAAASLEALNYSTDTMPIAVTLAQVTNTATDGYHSLRFVGQIALEDTNNYDSVGFKLEYCDGNGNIKTLYEKDTTTVYTAVKVNGTLTQPDDDYDYFYTYVISKIPESGTYYFKAITNAKGSASYQQSIKYYKLDNGTLTQIDPWDYPGSNASLTTTSGIYELYPDYIQ